MNELGRDIGLLVLRIGVGAMMVFSHGLSKLVHFSEYSTRFSDPIGLGSFWSLILVIFAEFFCATAVVLGLLTRLAVVPLMVTMAVATFIVHVNDPWSKKEFALLYFIPFLTLMFTGSGRFSLDALIRKKH